MAGLPRRFGRALSVAYNNRIGTTEVTNSQYVEFFTAKAASNFLGSLQHTGRRR